MKECRRRRFRDRQRPWPATRAGKLILLTSGTTGLPKGARHSGGGLRAVEAILNRTPWRAEETTVVAAPMFHAWGFGQLVLAAMMACTVVTRRKFDREATLDLVDRYRAARLAVVPVMFDRIMDLPDDVRNRYSGRSLRFAAASGSRMRLDVVIAFIDQFGDVIYANYNATEAGRAFRSAQRGRYCDGARHARRPPAASMNYRFSVAVMRSSGCRLSDLALASK